MNTNDDEFALAPGVMPTPTLPSISTLTRPFWDAAAEGCYILPRCNACGRHFFRPEVACPHCFATDWAWVPASGHGTLYSYSIVHRGPNHDRGVRGHRFAAVVRCRNRVRYS